MHVRSYACTHALPLCMYDRTHALPLYMYDRTHANNCLRTRLKPTTSLPRPRPREWKDSGSTAAQSWASLAAKAWRRCDLEEQRGQGCRNGRTDPQRRLRLSDPACDLTVLWAYYCEYKAEASRPPPPAADPRSTVPCGATLLAAPKARRQRLLLYLCAMWPQYS